MRDIKFRGKRVDNGEWVYGDLVKIHTRKGYGYGIRNTIEHVNDGFINLIPEEVISETVGQYTGLKDNNGTEIYEGDILKAYPNNSEYIGKVYYEDAQWFGACDYLNYAVAYSGAEVIGNIYENPELLEVSE